jgi:hypothetical protein
MRKAPVLMAILVAVLVFDSAVGNAASTTASGDTVYGNAPIGHLQPRAQQFSPHAPAEQAEQQQMSTFDAQQQKLDEKLDKSLNICRC